MKWHFKLDYASLSLANLKRGRQAYNTLKPESKPNGMKRKKLRTPEGDDSNVTRRYFLAVVRNISAPKRETKLFNFQKLGSNTHM